MRSHGTRKASGLPLQIPSVTQRKLVSGLWSKNVDLRTCTRKASWDKALSAALDIHLDSASAKTFWTSGRNWAVSHRWGNSSMWTHLSLRALRETRITLGVQCNALWPDCPCKNISSCVKWTDTDKERIVKPTTFWHWCGAHCDDFPKNLDPDVPLRLEPPTLIRWLVPARSKEQTDRIFGLSHCHSNGLWRAGKETRVPNLADHKGFIALCQPPMKKAS